MNNLKLNSGSRLVIASDFDELSDAKLQVDPHGMIHLDLTVEVYREAKRHRISLKTKDPVEARERRNRIYKAIIAQISELKIAKSLSDSAALRNLVSDVREEQA